MGLISRVVDTFCKYSSIDTCAVFHLISSNKLYAVTVGNGCEFVMSGFVEYECLYKPRKRNAGDELKIRLEKEKSQNKFLTVNMTIEDLQEVSRLEERKRLGRGELSAIAIAKKLNLGVTTDDRKAFKLAQDELQDFRNAQTVPQLLGWLLFIGALTDSDVPEIIREHTNMGESHHSHFEEIYQEAMRCKLVAR